MGAYNGLCNCLDKSLVEYAIDLGYDDSNILILEGDFNNLRNHHLDIYQNLLSCQHHSDRRTPLEYGQDLVASWIFEDFFINEIQNNDFSIELAGADKNRLILPNQKTSTSSDYVITTPQGIHINMELVNDYTGFWAKNQKLHLRDNKYKQMQQHKCLLLAIAMTQSIKKYTIFDFRNEIPAKYIPQHRPYGFKPAYELQIPTAMMHDFSINNVKQHITQLIN